MQRFFSLSHETMSSSSSCSSLRLVCMHLHSFLHFTPPLLYHSLILMSLPHSHITPPPLPLPSHWYHQIFENLQDHQWRCSRFRNLQQRRLTHLVRKIYLAWSMHAKWCVRFNLLHEAANADWTKVFFHRWREYAEICYATRHYRQTVKMIHKRCAFDCLRYNLKLNR